MEDCFSFWRWWRVVVKVRLKVVILGFVYMLVGYIYVGYRLLQINVEWMNKYVMDS